MPACIICGADVPEFVVLKNGKTIKKRRRDRRFCSLECYYCRDTSKETVEQKFWKRIDRNGAVHPVLGQCWRWTGWGDGYGYGVFSHGQERHIRAHRFSWELHNGEIPEELGVLHHCDNRECCNPQHLFLGTDQDNSDDKVSKGRQQRGENHGLAKLTQQQVEFIKSRPHSEREAFLLAEQFGVSKWTITDIFSGKNWKHV